MECEPTTCRIRVRWSRNDVPDVHAIRNLKDIEGLSDMTEELRLRWFGEIVKTFSSSANLAAVVRPWDILLHQDGSAETLSLDKGGGGFYPCRFRIPTHSVLGLDEGEKVKRAERFALGSLLYEVMTANQPFEELSDDDVQDHYSRGVFPDDVFSMAMGPYILGCWSLEFEKEMERLLKLPMGDRFRAYARNHPYLLASQVLGGVAMTVSGAALPVLGLVGFGASGPIAGSFMAAYQSSVGVVQAGSLFAFCQSVAMGGTAVNGIIACGAAGGGIALAATGGAVAGGQMLLSPEKTKEIFLVVYRKGHSEVGLTTPAYQSKI